MKNKHAFCCLVLMILATESFCATDYVLLIDSTKPQELLRIKVEDASHSSQILTVANPITKVLKAENGKIIWRYSQGGKSYVAFGQVPASGGTLTIDSEFELPNAIEQHIDASGKISNRVAYIVTDNGNGSSQIVIHKPGQLEPSWTLQMPRRATTPTFNSDGTKLVFWHEEANVVRDGFVLHKVELPEGLPAITDAVSAATGIVSLHQIPASPRWSPNDVNLIVRGAFQLEAFTNVWKLNLSAPSTMSLIPEPYYVLSWYQDDNKFLLAEKPAGQPFKLKTFDSITGAFADLGFSFSFDLATGSLDGSRLFYMKQNGTFVRRSDGTVTQIGPGYTPREATFKLLVER